MGLFNNAHQGEGAGGFSLSPASLTSPPLPTRFAKVVDKLLTGEIMRKWNTQCNVSNLSASAFHSHVDRWDFLKSKEIRDNCVNIFVVGVISLCSDVKLNPFICRMKTPRAVVVSRFHGSWPQSRDPWCQDSDTPQAKPPLLYQFISTIG